MSLFTPRSRYALYAVTSPAVDRRGRSVLVVLSPDVPPAADAGVHLRKQGQRLDHLASHYLNDPTGFWRIALQNDAVLPDAIAETRWVRIPRRP